MVTVTELSTVSTTEGFDKFIIIDTNPIMSMDTGKEVD